MVGEGVCAGGLTGSRGDGAGGSGVRRGVGRGDGRRGMGEGVREGWAARGGGRACGRSGPVRQGGSASDAESVGAGVTTHRWRAVGGSRGEGEPGRGDTDEGKTVNAVNAACCNDLCLGGWVRPKRKIGRRQKLSQPAAVTAESKRKAGSPCHGRRWDLLQPAAVRKCSERKA